MYLCKKTIFLEATDHLRNQFQVQHAWMKSNLFRLGKEIIRILLSTIRPTIVTGTSSSGTIFVGSSKSNSYLCFCCRNYFVHLIPIRKIPVSIASHKSSVKIGILSWNFCASSHATAWVPNLGSPMEFYKTSTSSLINLKVWPKPSIIR
jgi:hypothetical protein